MATSVVVSACSSNLSSGSSSGPSPSSGSTAIPAHALVEQLALDGSDAAFEHRYEGALAGGEDALVFAGRRGDQAVVYVCDGSTGTWFAGTVDADGYGTLEAIGGDGSATLAAGSHGPRVSFDRGDFNGRTAVLEESRNSASSLIRLEGDEATGGSNAALGGIIVTPTALRGTLTVSVRDGASDTITFEGASTSTATTTSTISGPDAAEPADTMAASSGSATSSIRPMASAGEGGARQITPAGSGTSAPSALTVVSGSTRTNTIATTTGDGRLTIHVTSSSPSAECAVIAALLKALTVQAANLNASLSQLTELRNLLTAQLAKATGPERAKIQAELTETTDDMAKISSALQQIESMTDELEAEQTSTCGSTPTPPPA